MDWPLHIHLHLQYRSDLTHEPRLSWFSSNWRIVQFPCALFSSSRHCLRWFFYITVFFHLDLTWIYPFTYQHTSHDSQPTDYFNKCLHACVISSLSKTKLKFLKGKYNMTVSPICLPLVSHTWICFLTNIAFCFCFLLLDWNTLINHTMLSRLILLHYFSMSPIFPDQTYKLHDSWVQMQLGASCDSYPTNIQQLLGPCNTPITQISQR